MDRFRTSERTVAQHKAKELTKRSALTEQYEATDSSSADEDIGLQAGPDVDSGVMYSYDAHKGPNHGTQILSQAVDRAVEHHVSKETEILVKNEYEVLGPDGEPVCPSRPKKALEFLLDEEDYELV